MTYGKFSLPNTRGENSRSAKLTEDDVREIRKSKQPASDLAKRFRCTESNILQIRKRRTWRHVQDEASTDAISSSGSPE